MANHFWLSLPKPSLSDARLSAALPEIVQVENLVARIIENASENALAAEKLNNDIKAKISELTIISDN